MLGAGHADGRDLSGGQWQGVGFARTLMRTDPLLLVLDEPASTLDAMAEQRLVDAYREVAADVAATVGGVTVLVTHRMSTVRLAASPCSSRTACRRCAWRTASSCSTVGASSSRARTTSSSPRARRYADLWAMQSRAYATTGE